MLIIGILIGAVSVIGVSRTAHLVSNDGYGRIPTRTSTHAFDLR